MDNVKYEICINSLKCNIFLDDSNDILYYGFTESVQCLNVFLESSSNDKYNSVPIF